MLSEDGGKIGMDSLAAEVEALEANEADRAEMLAIAEMMESLRPEGPVAGNPGGG